MFETALLSEFHISYAPLCESTLMPKFHISYSHTDWYCASFLFVRRKDSLCFGCSYQKLTSFQCALCNKFAFNLYPFAFVTYVSTHVVTVLPRISRAVLLRPTTGASSQDVLLSIPIFFMMRTYERL